MHTIKGLLVLQENAFAMAFVLIKVGCRFRVRVRI